MLNRDVGKGSVQGRADNPEWMDGGDVTGGAPWSFLVNIGTSGETTPAWDPIYPNRRDIYLKRVSRQETMMADAIYTLKTRAQTLNYELNGPDRAKRFAMDVLNNPGLGDDFINVVGKVVDDLLTSDNGAFLELWRAGNPKDDNSPVVGFGHMDSRQCWRTFDPEYPVIYTNPQTHERHRMHKNQVIMTADNVQPIEIARGIGFCATSRALQWMQVMLSTQTYKSEKISGRFTRAIGFVSGVTKSSLKKGLDNNQADADDAGFLVYNGIPIFASPGMAAGTEMKMILQDLASIPDGFDWLDEVTLYAYILAWTFGTDARDFWPATSSGATKGDATVQNMKARGKGIGWIIQTLEWMFRQALPASVSFEYDYTDDEQDYMAAQIQEKRVAVLGSLKRDGAIEAWEMRALAIAEGIIDGEILANLTPPVTSDDSSDNMPDGEDKPDEDAPDDEDEDKPDDPAESESAKAKTMASFRNGFQSATRGLWSGALSVASASSAFESTIRRGLTQAWIEGAAECGITQADFTDEEWAALNLFIVNQFGYLPAFISAIVTSSKANGGALEPLLSRAELWVNQYGAVRLQAKEMACSNQKMKWVYGATEKHCPTCEFYQGKVYRMTAWVKYLEPVNMLPHGSGLACGGHRCDCDLQPTDEPVNKGRVPIWVGKPGKGRKR